MKTLAMLLVLVCACKDSPCDKYADRLLACNPKLPGDVRENVYGYCVAATIHEPEPNAEPNRGDVLMYRAVKACSPTLACTDFLACLQEQNCTLITSINTPGELTFQCWPTPPPPAKLPQ
ncbi:MAG TPA: hypothetical protein VFV99_20505 [Kofleriaceae bacterium]|nr:hypothetical protein [Kofleriaceae bacterium]